MTGKFGFLTHVKKTDKKKADGRYLHLFICDCGNEVERSMNNVKGKNGRQSCGCRRGDVSRKHGMRNTRVYRIWRGMKGRCTNKNDKDYEKYSRLGICDEWLDFSNFYKDMGDPPSENHSIDRIDNDSGYFKDNCRWATVSQQARNRSNSMSWIVDGVEYDSVSDVAKAFGVKPPVAHRWFVGYKSKGKNYPPKDGFERVKKYND